MVRPSISSLRAAAPARSGAWTATAVQVTTLPVDVTAFRITPDGRSLVVALPVFVHCGTLACTSDRLKAQGAAVHGADL